MEGSFVGSNRTTLISSARRFVFCFDSSCVEDDGADADDVDSCGDLDGDNAAVSSFTAIIVYLFPRMGWFGRLILRSSVWLLHHNLCLGFRGRGMMLFVRLIFPCRMSGVVAEGNVSEDEIGANKLAKPL